MRNYEVTFIVDPVLSGDEIKSTAKTYEDLIKNESGKIIHMDDMGLRQLAYPINKRSSGVYFTIEFEIESNTIIAMLELSMQRDERIMRFLTIKLDKYGVKYNDDKRKGLIGKRKPTQDKGKKNHKEAVVKTASASVAKEAPVSKSKAAPSPEVKETSSPEVKDTSTPGVKEASAPGVKETSAPEVKEASAPEVKDTSTPEVKDTSTPEVKETSAPEVKETSAPEVKEASAPVANAGLSKDEEE